MTTQRTAVLTDGLRLCRSVTMTSSRSTHALKRGCTRCHICKYDHPSPPTPTSFLVNSRTLMGCTNPSHDGVSRVPPSAFLSGVGSLRHLCYPMYADVRIIDDSLHA